MNTTDEQLKYATVVAKVKGLRVYILIYIGLGLGSLILAAALTTTTLPIWITLTTVSIGGFLLGKAEELNNWTNMVSEVDKILKGDYK